MNLFFFVHNQDGRVNVVPLFWAGGLDSINYWFRLLTLLRHGLGDG